MEELSRRAFLKRTTGAATFSACTITGATKLGHASEPDSVTQVGTFIDLTVCDGCPDKDTPACVLACREKNQHRFPEPEESIRVYWPREHYEDWSEQRENTGRLTPYNWTTIQKVKVTDDRNREHELSIPRRCMHCDNPACANLCPFGVNNKMPEGPVVIDTDYCMGGAKCRSVCPWGIPMRQAGVGLYMKLAPKLAGGGVMYKCDMCYDLIQEGKKPACVEACPRGAIKYGDKEAMRTQAKQRAEEIGGYVYGDKEGGGTSTFYVSPVSFDKVNEALQEQNVVDGRPGQPHMAPGIESILETSEGYALSALIAPVAGTFAAGVLAHKSLRAKRNHEKKKQIDAEAKEYHGSDETENNDERGVSEEQDGTAVYRESNGSGTTNGKGGTDEPQE